MKKIILFSALLFVVSAFSVQALTLSPSSGTQNPGDIISIDLFAKPNGTGQNAVRIRLHVDNGVIQSFTPITDPKWLGTIPECGNNQFYTNQDLCLSMAKTTDIQAGEKLGTMQVKVDNARSLTISKGDLNGYTDGQNFIADTGIAATFSVNGTTPAIPEIPNPQPENIQPVPSTNVVSIPTDSKPTFYTFPGVLVPNDQTTQNPNMPPIIALGVTLFIVIGSAIFLIVRKKKKTVQLPATSPQPSAPQSVNQPPVENSSLTQNVTNQQAPSEPLPPLPPQATSL